MVDERLLANKMEDLYFFFFLCSTLITRDLFAVLNALVPEIILSQNEIREKKEKRRKE
jgi:hypothetical protein